LCYKIKFALEIFLPFIKNVENESCKSLTNFFASCSFKKFEMIVYRILSFIVNLFCAFAAMVTVFALLFLLQDPTALLQVFLMARVDLCGRFVNRFYAYVLIVKQKMTKKQKD